MAKVSKRYAEAAKLVDRSKEYEIEEAVALLLEEKIKFLQIAEIIEECMKVFEKQYSNELTLENIINLDKSVREYIRSKWELGVNN